ncbi:MAG: alanine racemase [Oligoflexia bacterium]|nr:alanine racemase [Oligoflexia bacterium]
MSRAVLEINLSLVKKNAQILKSMTPHSFFCPMLKADAYGLGAVPIAKALSEIGVKQVGVLNFEEAWPIRKALPKMDILIFGSFIKKEDLSGMLENNLTIVCSNWTDLKNLAQLEKKARLHLKFDTGFSRLGFHLNSVSQTLDFLKQNPQLKLEGFGTQLVSGEELGDKNSFSFQQLTQFLSLAKNFPNKKNHILNSAGLISQFAHSDSTDLGARPGISLYGIKPKIFFKNKAVEDKWNHLPLQPVSCLKSQIVALRELSKGAPVSYGAYWKAPKRSTIATVSLGYADGFFRAFGKKREVLFRGKNRPVIGAVCMDFFMIDLTDTDKEKPIELGEEVIIFEKDKLTVEDQATAINTIPYELFTSIGPRVKRVYINS